MNIAERMIAAGVTVTGKVHGVDLVASGASSNVSVRAVSFESAQEIDPGMELTSDLRQATYFHFTRPCPVTKQHQLIQGHVRWRVLEVGDNPINPTVRVRVEKLEDRG